MEKSYERFFNYNRKWVERQTEKDPEFFRKVYARHRPDFFLISCSDSRVSPNLMTGAKPGEIFVHRNVANLAVHTDLNFLSALQYSVEVLEVKHVVVVGHYGCGGVRAAMEDQYFGLIDNWLENIRDVIRMHFEELREIPDKDQRCKKLVEFNVIEQAVNVSHTSVIRKAWMNGQRPEVHGWVYDLEHGLIHDLGIRDKVRAALNANR